MNVVSRGIKNTLRSPLRSGAIVLMFAISVALVLSMLVARSSVQSKIDEVKATAGTSVTIRPAGTMGGMGGGDPLTADQLKLISTHEHITATTLTLTDQVSTDDTSLESSLELGAFGRRAQEQSSTSNSETSEEGNAQAERAMPAMTPRLTVTGTNDVDSISTDGSALTVSSGEAIDATGSGKVALIGSELATKNSLAVGATFTLYDETFTVSGIYSTGNTFQDGGVIIPLTTLQTITDQADAVNSVVATVDSSDNVASTVSTLKTQLGNDADITSEVERAQTSVTSLEGIASLAMGGVVAAAIAGSAIVLLAMVMIVRERRREIGVMKAIGGTNNKVIGQFIVEGMSLTVIGALVGLALGVAVSGPMTTSLVDTQSSSNSSQTAQQGGPGGSRGGAAGENSSRPAGGPGSAFGQGVSQIQANAQQVTASLTPSVFAIALGVTMLIAFIGTAIPAWFTARIRPAEVLRTE